MAFESELNFDATLIFFYILSVVFLFEFPYRIPPFNTSNTELVSQRFHSLYIYMAYKI